MTELLVLVLVGVVAGAAIGGGLVGWLAFRKGKFKPTVVMTVTGIPAAPIEQMTQPGQSSVIVHPRITVSLDVVQACAKGSGMVLVPKELAPPLH